MTPDEKEIWLADGIFKKIHIYSNTEDPKEIDSIDTPAGTYWLTFGLDGKLAYSSSGDVIDVKTHKIVGQMKDEYGRTMYSEKLFWTLPFDNEDHAHSGCPTSSLTVLAHVPDGRANGRWSRHADAGQRALITLTGVNSVNKE